MTPAPPPITYVIGTYPSLTTTFIDREISALIARDIDVRVISLRRPRTELSDSQQSLALRTEYVLPVRPLAMIGSQLTWLMRRPFAYFRLLAYLLTRPHGPASRPRTVAHFMMGVDVARRLRGAPGSRIHAHFADRAATVALVASRLLGTTYSLTAHANDIYVSPTLLEMKIVNSAVTVTCTEYNLQHLQGTLGPEAGRRVRRIYHGLDLERYTSIEPASGPTPLVVSVGQLKEKKGLRHLIEAMAILRDRGFDAECAIVGDGPLRAALGTLIRELRLDERVRLVGALPHPAVVDRYRNARMFVLPCVVAEDGDRDGIPNAILEAMAAGVPVISTPISGIPEAVRDGETGLMVEPANSQRLADAIERLGRDDALWNLLSRSARAFVVREFELARNTDRFLEVIHPHA